VAKDSPVTIHRNERVLAYMTITIVGLSIIAIFANLFGAGRIPGIGTTVAVLPLIGLPLGMILIIVLLVVSGRRRAREAAAAVAAPAKKR